MNLNLDKIKKVHFIGVGGIGMSAAAKLMLGFGKIVTGSDVCDSEIVEEVRIKGADIFIGSDERHIKKDIDLVVYSPAVPDNNPERAEAKKIRIKQISYPEFLGCLSRKMNTIAVSGTNGKSTTTSILSLILEKAGFDPTVIVGSKVKSFKDGNLRLSQKLDVASNLFVVEGCEYKAAMLNLNPEMIVLTNIEADHLDFYKNLEHIKRTFKKYIEKVEKDGVLIYNADDVAVAEVVKNYKGRKVGYGVEKSLKFKVKSLKLLKQEQSVGVYAKDIQIKKQRQIFTVWQDGKELGQIKLRIPGIFNVYNALAAIVVSLWLGIDFKIIKKSLEEFKGIWRRFEIVGNYKGAVIISDYAHHPTAVKDTIQAARDFYPNCRIVVVFQPHSHNRTLKLFTEFSESFNNADLVILSEIYGVEGRENSEDKISGRELADAARKCKLKNPPVSPFEKGGECNVFYAKNLKEAKEILLKNIKKNDVVLIMGAGDIYKLKF